MPIYRAHRRFIGLPVAFLISRLFCETPQSEQMQKRKGRRSVACAPHTSLELLHFCFSEHCLCACRGQRQLSGCHNKHPISANKHGHRHYRCGGYVLMFHLLELSSSFHVLSRYTLRNSACIIYMPTITGSIAICQAEKLRLKVQWCTMQTWSVLPTLIW